MFSVTIRIKSYILTLWYRRASIYGSYVCDVVTSVVLQSVWLLGGVEEDYNIYTLWLEPEDKRYVSYNTPLK